MREPIPTWTFALVVIRDGERILLIDERKHGGGWYLPGGRVEPGEGLEEAAKRETLEEAGIEVEIDGIHRVQYTPIDQDTARLRVIFVGHPMPGSEPKSRPDEHTLAARWFHPSEIPVLHLRHPEMLGIVEALPPAGVEFPLRLLEREEPV